MEGNKCYRFPKEERLHHRSLVEGLFRYGKSFYEFPFRVTWRVLSHEDLQRNFRSHIPENIGKVQMMVTVPKKKIRKAVDRVKIRRQIRESYRINRHQLSENIGIEPSVGTISLAYVYIHTERLPYFSLEEKMVQSLAKLQRKISEKFLQESLPHTKD